MKKNDLTQVKNIGPARMKLLNDSGITTIEQLDVMPLEKLAQIQSIGRHYAKLIKDGVAECYGEKLEKLPVKTVSTQKEKMGELNRKLLKQIKRLNKRLKQVDENLKPLWKKKYLEFYIDLKKRADELKSRLNDIEQIHEDLPRKIIKKIIKNADTLNSNLKKIGKKPKKKKYIEITQGINLFSRMLRDTFS